MRAQLDYIYGLKLVVLGKVREVGTLCSSWVCQILSALLTVIKSLRGHRIQTHPATFNLQIPEGHHEGRPLVHVSLTVTRWTSALSDALTT